MLGDIVMGRCGWRWLMSRKGRLGIEAVEAFEEAARDLEVGGSGWTAADAHASLEDQIAAHVRQLEQQKVPSPARLLGTTDGRIGLPVAQ